MAGQTQSSRTSSRQGTTFGTLKRAAAKRAVWGRSPGVGAWRAGRAGFCDAAVLRVATSRAPRRGIPGGGAAPTPPPPPPPPPRPPPVLAPPPSGACGPDHLAGAARAACLALPAAPGWGWRRQRLRLPRPRGAGAPGRPPKKLCRRKKQSPLSNSLKTHQRTQPTPNNTTKPNPHPTDQAGAQRPHRGHRRPRTTPRNERAPNLCVSTPMENPHCACTVLY